MCWQKALFVEPTCGPLAATPKYPRVRHGEVGEIIRDYVEYTRKFSREGNDGTDPEFTYSLLHFSSSAESSTLLSEEKGVAARRPLFSVPMTLRRTNGSAGKKPAAHCIAPRLVRRAHKTAALLKRKKLTVVTAESCTGGLISAALSQAEGASKILAGAFVTYTKEQKAEALGIGINMLRRHGAVTAAVALRMAKGALKRSKATVALSVTGVLGPKPDEDGNPVGLVYFACMHQGRAAHIYEDRFSPRSHDHLRSQVVLTAFDIIEDCVRRGRGARADRGTRKQS
jgi:nicotinamide-nucleotide amidase